MDRHHVVAPHVAAREVTLFYGRESQGSLNDVHAEVERVLSCKAQLTSFPLSDEKDEGFLQAAQALENLLVPYLTEGVSRVREGLNLEPWGVQVQGHRLQSLSVRSEHVWRK